MIDIRERGRTSWVRLLSAVGVVEFAGLVMATMTGADSRLRTTTAVYGEWLGRSDTLFASAFLLFCGAIWLTRPLRAHQALYGLVFGTCVVAVDTAWVFVFGGPAEKWFLIHESVRLAAAAAGGGIAAARAARERDRTDDSPIDEAAVIAEYQSRISRFNQEWRKVALRFFVPGALIGIIGGVNIILFFIGFAVVVVGLVKGAIIHWKHRRCPVCDAVQSFRMQLPYASCGGCGSRLSEGMLDSI